MSVSGRVYDFSYVRSGLRGNNIITSGERWEIMKDYPYAAMLHLWRIYLHLPQIQAIH